MAGGDRAQAEAAVRIEGERDVQEWIEDEGRTLIMEAERRMRETRGNDVVNDPGQPDGEEEEEGQGATKEGAD